MRVLIIEDEPGVAQNLRDILIEIDRDIEVLAILESVKKTIDWLKKNPVPDLGFFDIRLADGDSFEIFEKTAIDFPVVFTTAYDEYALKAFKVNSIDYLLKPIDKEELEASLNKYESYHQKRLSVYKDGLSEAIRELRMITSRKYRKTFLIHHKDRILPIGADEIAYFRLQDELVFCYTHDNKRYLIDQSLEGIEEQLDPDNFFRANRQFMVSRKSVKSAYQHFNRKLKLDITPVPGVEILISKTKATAFKNWLQMG